MFAPEASRSLVTACFSSSVTGGAGLGIRAEAPPEIRQMTRSLGSRCLGDGRDALGAANTRLVRHRMAAFVQFDAPQPGAVAVLDVDEAGVNAAAEQALDGLRHGRAGLARADHEDLPERTQPVGALPGREPAAGDPHVSQNRLGGIGCFERGAEDRCAPEP